MGRAGRRGARAVDDPRLRRESQAAGEAAGEAAEEASVVHGVLQRELGLTGSYQALRRELQRRFPAKLNCTGITGGSTL